MATEHASIHATGVTLPPPSQSSAVDFGSAAPTEAALAMVAMATAVTPKQRSNFTSVSFGHKGPASAGAMRQQLGNGLKTPPPVPQPF
jgi:hypothetical protein